MEIAAEVIIMTLLLQMTLCKLKMCVKATQPNLDVSW